MEFAFLPHYLGPEAYKHELEVMPQNTYALTNVLIDFQDYLCPLSCMLHAGVVQESPQSNHFNL